MLERLIEKYKLQLDQDEFGFVDTRHCDSTFLSGLIGSNKQISVDLIKAKSDKWYRRPYSYPECFFCKESRSTVSRDTLLGVFWWAYTNQRNDVLEDIWKYAWKHYWKMGEGRHLGLDTIMNPIMMSTLALLLGKSWFSWITGKWRITKDPKDFYINRLTALHIGLRRFAGARMSKHDEEISEELFRIFPDNPLFAWACGKWAESYNLLHIYIPENIPSGVHNKDEYIYEWLFVAGRLI